MEDGPASRKERKPPGLKHRPTPPKHDQSRKQKRIDKAYARARADKHAHALPRNMAGEAIDATSAPTTPTVPFDVPASLTETRLCPAGVLNMIVASARARENAYVSREAILTTLLLCLRQFRLSRDVLRYIASFVTHQQMIVVGGYVMDVGE
jgi:hypothetical protein